MNDVVVPLKSRAPVPQSRAAGTGAGEVSAKHLVTVVLEDYFHVAPLKSVVHSDQWYRFERRVESNTLKALDLLDEYGVRATFFVLGSIADEMPELVRKVVERGHEVASKGYFHHCIKHFNREEFREDVVRSREALERASGQSVHGFRIGHQWFGPEDLWALDVLCEEGFVYDSSVRPLFWRYAGEPWRRHPHTHHFAGREIHEFPLCTWTIGGLAVPISGGNYFRQFPHWMVRRAVASWIGRRNDPFLMYFHVWELDPDQPRVTAAPWHERIRQYRNLERMESIVRYYLERYEFVGIADHLGLLNGRLDYTPDVTALDEVSAVHFDPTREAVTVVVPCFNEELILPYLSNTLEALRKAMKDRYQLKFVFVDDGSADGTWGSLHEVFGGRDDCEFLRHDRNRGVAAAILTGLAAAETEIVCSIDCDCTYDPHQLDRLIPMLTDGVDMVTASPYHPDGEVRNVPPWRLFLSKRCSSIYRLVLHQKLATYTSCFRVYRRAAMANLKVSEGGFLGVAEMIGRLDLDGGTVVECPAVLEVRLLGRSKMKTLRTILGHLKLLSRLGLARAGRVLLRPKRAGYIGDSCEPLETDDTKRQTIPVTPESGEDQTMSTHGR